MNDYTLWWLAAGAAVIAELLTGTFYLLMTAVGLAAGAVAAHLGAPPVAQTTAAAVAGGIAVLLCWTARRRRPPPPDPTANRDLNLDIGQTVHVAQWLPDGTAQVQHRGARWHARLQPPQANAEPGTYRIRAIEGSELILGR